MKIQADTPNYKHLLKWVEYQNYLHEYHYHQLSMSSREALWPLPDRSGSSDFLFNLI